MCEKESVCVCVQLGPRACTRRHTPAPWMQIDKNEKEEKSQFFFGKDPETLWWLYGPMCLILINIFQLRTQPVNRISQPRDITH